MTVRRHVARPITTENGGRSWTVCDPDGIPVLDVDDYFQALRARPVSVNTLKSYGEHLAALLTYLDVAGGLTWDQVGFTDLTEFMVAYRTGVHPVPKRGSGPRGVNSMRSAAAAIRGFYDFHRHETGRGPENLRLSKEVRRGGHGNPHHFLAHVEARQETHEVNRLSHGMPIPDQDIQIIDFERDFVRMLTACRSARDRLLISGFYDLGMRIGGLLGLKHGDLDVRRRIVTVTRREDNPNGALSKRKGSFIVHAGQSRFFDLYRDYLLNEVVAADIQSDFVFVNLRHAVGRPLSHSNAFQQVQAIGLRAGVGAVNPHMLRHTHATALAKAGWTSAEIAARLGQKSAASADVYVHLASDDIERRLTETEHLVWPGLSEPQMETAQ